MAEDEMKLTSEAQTYFLNGQIEHAKATLAHGLKLYPESIAMQDLIQRYQHIKALNVTDIQEENVDLKQNKGQDEVKLEQITNTCKSEQDIINEIKQANINGTVIEHKLRKMANASFQMRLKVLNMEIKVVDTYYVKKLIENENEILKKTRDIGICMCTVYTALDLKKFEKAEYELLRAENLSTEMMRKIKTVVKKNIVKKEEVKIPEDDKEVPDYRSIVTVRGTKEDVTNCILKAKRALENGKYDRAESLLLKAERIFPTKNARDLLKQVQVAREPKQTSDPIETATEDVEQVDTIHEDGSKSEYSASAVKCITAFERAFNTGNFEKSERMLNKAKRFDPSLDVEQKLSQVNTARTKKIMEEKRKEEIEKAKREIKMAGVCLYKSIKAYGAGDFVNAEQILLRAKTYDPSLNLDPELLMIRNKMSSSSKGNKDTDKTEPEETVTDIKFASECLYKAKKAFDAGNFKEAERNLNNAKACDSSLDLEPLLSKCRAEVASRSSTEGNKVIPKNDTVTKYSKENTELCKYNVEQAEIAYKNKNINETSMFLTSAKSYYPCTEIDKTIEYVEKCNKNKRENPSHEITTSETEFSCLEDEKQKEIEMQIERREKEVVEKEKSKMKKCELVINKTSKDQESSLDNEKDKLDVRLDVDADTHKSGKDKKQSSNRIRLQVVDKFVKKARHLIHTGELEDAKVVVQNAVSIHATPTDKSLMKQIEQESLNNPKSTNNSSKYKADTKTTKRSTKEEQVKSLICVAEKAIYDQKFEEALNFLNTAEELYPTEHAKKLINNVNEIIFSCDETSVLLNCYEFPVEANESDSAEALKCVKMAEDAYQAGRHDRAEHLLTKSLRICYTQSAESFLDVVRNAKSQNNPNIKTEKCYNEYVKSHSLNESNSEYNKCIDVGEKAIAEGDFAKAERFLSKAIRINPNDDARNQLQHVQHARSSQPLGGDVISKTVKSDVDIELERVVETFINLGLQARKEKKFNVARIYLEHALEKLPNEKTRELLQDVQSQIDRRNGRHSQFQTDIKFEANRLLDKVDNLISIGDLERAELFLIMSWDMNRSQRTTSVHKKFLKARLARFEGYKKHKRDGRNGGNSKNIFESDKLVKSALDKYEKNNIEEAENLLTRAAEFYPSDRINKLLFEIRIVKNKGDGPIKKICNYVVRNKCKDCIMSLDEKMRDAKKSIEIAENAISVENFVKAKRMLLKAERIYPTDTAQQLLKRIERLTLNINNNFNQNENDIMAAEKCITIARIAIGNNNIGKAERFLLKSINIYPIDEAKELLEKLKNGHGYNEQIKPTGTLETAEECIERAQNAFYEGNCKKALRLLTKSERIYPTARAKDLMKQVKEKLSENGEDPDEVLKEVRRSTIRKDAEVPPPQPKKREVTSEQISEIQRVKQANDDYDILGIPRGSSGNEVKKAYKYLTKVLHPDKNRAPGAKEAFMMVKEATDHLKSKLRSHK